MTEAQTINRYMRGWISRADCAAELAALRARQAEREAAALVKKELGEWYGVPIAVWEKPT